MHICLYVKEAPDAQKSARELFKWLQDHGATVCRITPPAPEKDRIECKSPEGKSSIDELDCVIVMGGDGTFLSAARFIGDAGIPIIGVKFGDLGFMAETGARDLYAAAQAILAGAYIIEKRMRLDIEILRDGKVIAKETALNDAVVNKGAEARLASFDTFINQHFLTTYRSDGLIVATPTGSTAYSLAAGGPILHPAVSGIILSPICPFTLTNRPLVVPDNVLVEIRIGEKEKDILLTADGQVAHPVTASDLIRIRKSPHPVKMIRMPNKNYFDVLKAKLHWSGGRI